MTPSPEERAIGLVNQDCEHMKYGCAYCAEDRIAKALKAYGDERLDEAVRAVDNFPNHESAHEKMKSGKFGACGLCTIATSIKALKSQP